MVNGYLLDTHTFLWMTRISDISNLGKEAKMILENPDSVLFVSPVSLFEIQNKYRQGKLPEFALVAENMIETLDQLEVSELSLNWAHAERAGRLDWNHKDPFDRLLAAQAQMEELTLITCDKVFNDAPNLELLW